MTVLKNIAKRSHRLGHTCALVSKDTFHQMKDAQLFMVASSQAYITILSIIPLLAVSFSIFHFFGGTESFYQKAEMMILSNLTAGTSEDVIDHLLGFIKKTHSGALGAGGFAALVVTCTSMLSSADRAINQVWHTNVSRSWMIRFTSYWFFIALGPLGFSVAVGVATSKALPLSSVLPSGLGMFLISVGLFFCVYKWVPHARVRSISAFIAATVAACLWTLARHGYHLYTQNVVTYHKVYGSLGAIPIVLLWIYIVWIITLGGAALASAIQKNIDS